MLWSEIGRLWFSVGGRWIDGLTVSLVRRVSFQLSFWSLEQTGSGRRLVVVRLYRYMSWHQLLSR
jgi:hypothetical protein